MERFISPQLVVSHFFQGTFACVFGCFENAFTVFKWHALTLAYYIFPDTKNTPGYLGCFRDSPTSHDLEYLADIRPLSIRGCVTKCKSMRFPYAGVQYSSSCYCGLHYGKYGQVEHEDCNTPCEADASEMCGGLEKNSLYHTGMWTEGSRYSNCSS